MQKERIVGTPALRKEGVAKVRGAARYIDDMSFPGMIYGATVRSSIPRGRISKIELGDGIPWDEFVVVSAKDIPGENVIAMINKDWPCLVDEQVNHPEEPILLLAHADRHLLPKAVAAVRIEY
ncbi:MAG: carbon monoxide dehydrogenase, partial [Alloacidobacterium sp.]